MKDKFNLIRFPLLLVGISLLLAAMWAGLIRMGWKLPNIQPTLPLSHGPLMISGFLGTLIGIERAVAVRKRWVYLGPLMSAVGGVSLIIDPAQKAGPILIVLSSLVMLLVFIEILFQHISSHNLVMALGALMWFVGNEMWLFGRPVYQMVYWWIGFLVFTIAGERLELGKLTKLQRNVKVLYFLILSAFIIGLLVLVNDLQTGMVIFGVSLLALAFWSLSYDAATRAVRQAGLPKFVAVCLLLGYAWLGFGGVMMVFYKGVTASFSYDVILHAIFLGFSMSMIFGHGPIIFPAVLMRNLEFDPRLYFPLGLLHITVLGRVLGNLLLIQELQLWNGMLNAIAILLYFVIILNAVRKAKHIWT